MVPQGAIRLSSTSSPEIRRALLQQLECLQRAGVRILPRPHGVAADAAAPSPLAESKVVEVAPPQSPAVARPASDDDVAPAKVTEPVSGRSSLVPDMQGETHSMNRKQRREALDVVRAEVAHCTRCHELAASRTQTVFGVGNPAARLVFLGEAPGADEDKQGEPFVGRAGQLLNKIIEACSLQRDQVYILNILKCRPPGNRNPSPEEASNCREFLRRQLEILQPEYLCCLGAVAAQNLLNTTVPIGRLRGSFHDFEGIKVMATYHPAYLLRNPSAKRATWDDMKMLMQDMGIQIPEK